MFNFEFLVRAILTLTFFSVSGIAQTPPSPVNVSGLPDSQIQNNFTSLEGEFSIDLPEFFSGYKGFPPDGDIKSGSQFQWQTPNGNFAVVFQERLSVSLAVPGEYLDNIATGLVRKMADTNQGKFISRQPLTLAGNTGVEVVLRLKTGKISVVRGYIIKNRLYLLQTGWAANEDGAVQKKILDSFKIVDAKTILAQKLIEATPEPLPQSPAAKKKKSDAQDDGLKGQVKSVSEESEDISAAGKPVGRRLSSVEEYDRKGSELKHIYYDYRGNPYNVTVYGFIDGARVSNSKSVRYEYDPPPALPAKSADAENVKRDSRYELRYKYQYTKGKLTEEKLFDNKNLGTPIGRHTYNYRGNELEELVYDKQGKLNQKYLTVFDDKRNEIEKTFYDLLVPQIYGDKKYRTVYDSFDDKGNWTKKTVSLIKVEDGKEVGVVSYIKYWAIIYYP